MPRTALGPGRSFGFICHPCRRSVDRRSQHLASPKGVALGPCLSIAGFDSTIDHRRVCTTAASPRCHTGLGDSTQRTCQTSAFVSKGCLCDIATFSITQSTDFGHSWLRDFGDLDAPRTSLIVRQMGDIMGLPCESFLWCLHFCVVPGIAVTVRSMVYLMR